MDLRSILNVEDRPKLATRSKQGSRADVKAIQTRSNVGGQSARTGNGANKMDGVASTPMTPVMSPTYGAYSSGSNWMANTGLSGDSSGSQSTPGRSISGNRPRISLSTSSASSMTVKRRASAHSPVSYSSSSCSSPSPRTPSSMTSAGISFGYVPSGVSRLHNKIPMPGKYVPEIPEGLSPYHQMTPQDLYTTSVLPSNMRTDHIVQTTPLHLNRLLPPPVSGTMPNPTQYHQCVTKEHAVASQQMTPKSTHFRHTAAQRLCSASTNCENTTPKRRIVSQFFGRNKKETRLIPRHCWVFYCRQHYQRSRYRLDATRFAELQMSLVRTTVAALEKEKIVASWEIRLRKRAQERLAKSEREMKGSRKLSAGNKNASATGSGTREKTLLPYCGSGKSFDHVFEVLDAVNAICRRDGGSALEFELLPSFTKEHQFREEARRRACREEGYGSDSESDDDD